MKLVKYILCLAILLGTIPTAYAETDKGAAEALKMVKERIDTSEYTEFKSTYYKEDGEETRYSFTWTKKDDEYSELYVSVCGKIITYYSESDYSGEEGGKFALDKDEALLVASDFIKRINPDIYEHIELLPQKEQWIYSDLYSIDLYREENGIPVLNQMGGISVSKSTKRVSYFYIDYEDGVEFKPLDGIMSEEDAKAAYIEKVPLGLRYRYKTDYSKKEITPFLEYAAKNGITAINAVDGSLYEVSYGDRFLFGNGEEKSMAADEAGGAFSPAELEELDKIAGLLTEAQAEQKIRNNEIIKLPKKYEMQNVSFGRNYFNKNEYFYNFDFGNDGGYAGVNIDAKTGEILSFYKYENRDIDDKQNADKEIKAAKKALTALAGDKAAEFRIEESEYTGDVQFVRVYDGLDVVGDGAYFSFDGEDNITNYSLHYKKDMAFPSKEGVISKKSAFENAFDALGFELGYAIDNENKIAMPVYYIGENAEAKDFTMNPFTGKITDYDGEDMRETGGIDYTDIENHYGKDIFLKLAEYGIGFEGNELKPDEPITQAEYFTLLNKVFGYYETDRDELYKQMISRGTIKSDERADDSVLTRENAAIFMVREIGAEQYAKHDDIFVAPFNDVTENKGYIAVLKAEKVLNGDGSGNFYPKNTVTRGEALIMIYNYFTK